MFMFVLFAVFAFIAFRDFPWKERLVIALLIGIFWPGVLAIMGLVVIATLIGYYKYR